MCTCEGGKSRKKVGGAGSVWISGVDARRSCPAAPLARKRTFEYAADAVRLILLTGAGRGSGKMSGRRPSCPLSASAISATPSRRCWSRALLLVSGGMTLPMIGSCWATCRFRPPSATPTCSSVRFASGSNRSATCCGQGRGWFRPKLLRSVISGDLVDRFRQMIPSFGKNRYTKSRSCLNRTAEENFRNRAIGAPSRSTRAAPLNSLYNPRIVI